MTTIRAHSIGSNVSPFAFEGVVVGVYQHTSNIKLSDGSLITCAMSDFYNLPRGLVLDAPQGFEFKKHLNPGMRAHFRGGIIRFSNSAFKIDLRNASIWIPEFVKINSPNEVTLVEQWMAACRDDSFDFELPDLFAGDISQIVSMLIGRGPGLTPMGDDVLVGLLAAPTLLAPSEAQSLQLKEAVRKLVHLIGDISRQMLSDACDGYFIEPLCNFISALYGDGDIKDAHDELKAVGHSSGNAMIMGVIAGISRVERYPIIQNTKQLRAA